MNRPWAHTLAVPALVLTPLAVVVAARMIFPLGGPAMASAAQAPEPIEPVWLPEVGRELPQDRVLAEAALRARSMPEPRSPLAWTGALPSDLATRAAQAEPDPDPTFQVTSVMRLRGSPRAVINGRVRAVGDPVEDGWRVSRIDPETQAVWLENAGKIVRATLRPAEEPR